jgi:histidinol-phosphate phosphatase family protein
VPNLNRTSILLTKPQDILKFDKTWTLFLDRDGVINERLAGEYVKKWADFAFMPNSLKAIEKLSHIFGRIVVVTNQAGIGKGLMTEARLNSIHSRMVKTINAQGGRIDNVYFAPDLPINASNRRKPGTGMPLDAQKDFPEIHFPLSAMVGDSNSDMEMGDRLGMVKVFIEGKGEDPSVWQPHFRFNTLWDFTNSL